MVSLQNRPDAHEKLRILSQDSQYDLACACGTKNSADHRHRSTDGKWIYPVVLPEGRRMFLLKTLVSNVCVNNCKYCPLRINRDPQRCTLGAEELADVFFDYYNARKVHGLFISSGVTGTPDATMQRIIDVASILRNRGFGGYIHLKVIPGSSDAAIEQALSLANAVSLNIETAGENHFKKLCSSKSYLDDVIRPIKLIGELTQKGARFSKVSQSTQFVVGASNETDREIVKYSWGLYQRLNMSRVYFSAYQRGLGEMDLPGENARVENADMLTREHRLYQVDWLMRRYGFKDEEIPFDPTGNLSLTADPKELWASAHPEFFPLDINRAGYYQLLRVPGLGPTTIKRIMDLRRQGTRLSSITDFGRTTKLLRKAQTYLKFGHSCSGVPDDLFADQK
jgi:predicted DNA-binding helix-hairpin-helix protein